MLCCYHRTKQGKTGGHMQSWYKETFGDDGYVNYLTVIMTVSQGYADDQIQFL